MRYWTPELEAARRSCPVCGRRLLTPFNSPILTAHEFYCYKRRPDLVPAEHKARFEKELLGERRSEAAFRGVETRRQRGGKRAPRKNVKYTYRSTSDV